MSVRILLEIGHEAALRTKRTPEGFTHDWEIFVRGCDADIHHYVEKVVFNLHETFTKPRRVVKEPPYAVKESGYAGFNLPIEIYLKNNGEPKKISFYYDLHLQQSGPAILKVRKEKYVFPQPSDEFRIRLLKGGGTIVNANVSHNDNSRENSMLSEERGQLVDKPKLGGDLSRKHKIRPEENKTSNTFSDLFGPPINKIAKVSPEPKNQNKSSPKSTAPKLDKNIIIDKSKAKYSPHKDQKDREKSLKEREYDKKNREEKRNKDKSKERDRSKDKTSKREKSPKHLSASPRRSPKREISPKRLSPKRTISPVPKPKIDERGKIDDTGQKPKLKLTEVKAEKKQKKDKRDRTKDRDRERKEHKVRKEENKVEIEQKEIKPVIKELQKVNKDVKEKEKIKDKLPKYPEFKEETKTEKAKGEKHEMGERHRHKHKKKDREKNKKDDKDRDKERKHEKKNAIAQPKIGTVRDSPTKIPQVDIDKDGPVNRNANSTTSLESFSTIPPVEKAPNPLNALMAELSENGSSDSSNSLDGSSLEASISKTATVTPNIVETKPNVASPKLIPPIVPEVADKTKGERSDKTKKGKKHKERHKTEKSPEKDIDKKKKRKSGVKNKDPAAVSPEKNAIEERPSKILKDEMPEVQLDEKSSDPKQEDASKISPDYMCILKDLQQKIMTLQDNSDLQRVVQLIAETGQYEITRQTFDFDLCALDRGTVKRLQEFFAAT